MKSVFVSMYMTAVIVITVMAGYRLWASEDYLGWGGVLLVTVPFLIVLGRLMIFQNVARTSARLPVVIVLAALGTVMSFWAYARGGSIGAPVLAVAGLAGLLAYSFWYSSFRNRSSEQLKVGSILPDFELLDASGSRVSPEDFRDKPTIWIFYRGNWCPLCMAQIKETAATYREIEDLGGRVALISPQPHAFTRSLARKFAVAFEFLTDEGNRAARTLGIEHAFGIPLGMQMLGYDSETVLPTVVITDRGGKILWTHETDNYRVRPEPDDYLAVLRSGAASN